MTTGVYKLIFAEGVEYIGKSIDIEQRWNEHYTSMLRNKAAAKLQSAYKVYGIPKGIVLIECHRDHIDFLEDYYIEVERPMLNTVRLDSTMNIEDFELVRRNEHLLQKSTMDHLKLLDEYETALENADEEINELLQEYDSKRVQEEAVQELIRETKKFDIAIELKNIEIKELQSRLQKLELPWYKKLLG